MFTQSQIQHLLDIIDFQSSLFIAGNLSTDILSEEDKQILSKFGIDWESFTSTYTPAQQLFYFGRLAGVLGPLNAQKVTYKDLEKYLQRGQFVPLNSTEKKILSYLEKKTYSYIKGLGETIKSSLTGKIADEDLAKRSYYEHVLNEAFREKIIDNKSIKDVVEYIGKNTGDWERDLGRIAETELQNFYEYGKGEVLAEKYGGDKRIFYKQVYPGACQHCIRLYLTNGIGSEPRLFTYQELLDNGTNIGKKSKDWLPVLGTVHPFCRCDLRNKLDETDTWDKKKQLFVSNTKESENTKGKIKITVGDKIFEV